MRTKFTIDYEGRNDEFSYWLEIEYETGVVTISDCASYAENADKSLSTIAISKSDFLKVAKLLESL